MKKLRLLSQNGQEVQQADINIPAALGALCMDFAVSEFFRLQMRIGAGTAPKGVIPFSTFKTDGVNPQTAGIVTSSGVADRTISIYPFKALVAVVDAQTLPEEAWTQTRTVDVVNSDGNPGVIYSSLQLGTTDGTHSRCDLVWVKISVLQMTEITNPYVRNPTTGVISNPATPTQYEDLFTLGVTPGTPFAGTTPVRPPLPADTSTEFYIPLAYVFVPASFGANVVDNKLIHEVAPCVPPSRATGATTMRPANGQYDKDGALLTQEDFTATGRPSVYLPPTMSGAETLMLALNWQGGATTPALNGNRVVDSSVDWRHRVFKWTACADDSTGTFSWNNGSAPRAANSVETGIGQSFVDDGTAGISQAGGIVAKNIGSGALSGVIDHAISLYVNLSDGKLYCKVPNLTPNALVFIWVEASGQFANAS